MLKKFAGFLLLGGALAACDSTVPVGGNGYFDTPQPTIAEPVNLVPAAPASDDDTAGALSNAVATALADTAPTPDATGIGASATPTTPTGSDTTAAITETGASAIKTDDGSLNLDAETFAEQKVKRDAAAAVLAAAREKYTIIEPGTLPTIVAGVNIAEYARSTTNPVGKRIYKRPIIKTRFAMTECGKYSTPDDAQRYFLANGGPEQDPLNLDSDGDGFACHWSPEPFRLLQ